VTLLGVTALLSGIALIWRELTTDEPVINFRILKSRQLTAGVTFGLFLGFALYGSVFILPVFLQQLLQMTAWQTGKIILPGAIASAVTMAVVGRNAMRLDARYTVVAGAFLFFWSMLKMSHLTSASGQQDLFWPLILRGVALGLIFVPLTNATMADLKVKDLAQGTGMFNLMRQLGGSLGIAIMATLLAHFMSVEKTMLVEHVGANDPETLSRLSLLARGLISRGMNPITAQQQALAILDRQVSVQSSMLAFSKIYLYSGLVLIGALPLLLLFRTGRARGSMGPVH
jgi:DHA2 family multidrug resistance protein